MFYKNGHKDKPHLKVFLDRSELVEEDGKKKTFHEGKQTGSAKARLEKIRSALQSEFLEFVIQDCRKPDIDIEELPEQQAELIERLVNSVTSEVGRAVVGLR